MLQNSDLNTQFQPQEPITLVHEYSTTEFYVGVSNNGNDTSKANWQIKKISKSGNVWNLNKFPDGDQSFKYVWDDRLTYIYK